MNYKIRIEIQQLVCFKKIHYLNGLTLWHGFEQRIINNTPDEWCKRLRVCVHIKKNDFLVFSLTADYTFAHFNVVVW